VDNIAVGEALGLSDDGTDGDDDGRKVDGAMEGKDDDAKEGRQDSIVGHEDGDADGAVLGNVDDVHEGAKEEIVEGGIELVIAVG